MRTKGISLLTAVALSTMAFSAAPVNAVDTTSVENSMVISYTYENGMVDAVLSVDGAVCIGGFEATLNYNNSVNKVKEKTAVNSNILMNDIPSKGEIAVSMAANNNLTDESDIFKISFESDAKPNKSDFSFEITDMYMFNESLDSESVDYIINEKWNGFDEATTTTTQSTTTASTTTTTTELKSADLSDNKFIVSVQENKESNAVEVSLSVKGKVEFWTAEGSIKLDMVGLGTPTFMNAISDALTSYNEDTSSILFTVVSSSGQNITDEQTIFTYSVPIKSSEYSITCDPKIADICNADYNDVKYEISVSGAREHLSVTTTSNTTSTKQTSTTKQASTTTSKTISETTTTSNTTTETTSSITSNEQISTSESSATGVSTTTEEATVNTSPNEMLNWAENDYYKKTGIEPHTSTYTENENGTLTITLHDKDDNVLEKYIVHSKNGIGFNGNGEEVNLPQTGNNSMTNWIIVFGALMLIGFGLTAIKLSRIVHRQPDEE